ncbi:hypothetical protein AYO44_05000 [Planctomycetaceae bacterium SCGC AG-212-F19]|nr:hypothetical protein AYO44_05000 [Planctomycetaceae bacterium SCGC AG-212-F19]
MSTDPRPASNPAETTQQPAAFAVDASQLSTVYANFCRVTGTPEELVLDFGLNTQMAPNAAEPIKLTHRLVMNFFTAKRLLGALHMALQQHEGVYGALEVDVQKRVRGGAVRHLSPPLGIGSTPGQA